MSRYQAYAEYVQSDIPWVGQMPNHWAQRRFKYVLIDKKKTSNSTLEAGAISFGRVVFKDSDSIAQETKDSYQEVLAGEYLVNPLNLNYDLLSLRTALSEINVVVSTGYIVLKSNGQLRPRYIRWLLHEFDVSHMKTLGAGVRQTINYADIGNSYFCEPTEHEQEQIANFLDHETAKIDLLIEKQQALIELLKEKRQAVISHAVTKGLNPNAPMKDSGVEWLGEVPAHWDVCLLKFKCNEITDGAHISPDTENGEHLFVSITDIKKGVINFENALLTSKTSYEYLIKTGCMPFAGDILFSKDGTIGQTAITPDGVEFVVASSLIIIRPDSTKVTSGFLDFLLQSSLVAEQVESFVKGAALRRLSIQNLLKIFGVFPPIDEQVQISDYLTRVLGRFDELEEKAQELIKHQQERRTALISAAVTGKIDVRNWQAPSNKGIAM